MTEKLKQMDNLDYIEYMDGVAQTLKDITQSGDGDHFSAATNLNKLDDFLNGMKFRKGFQLVAIDFVRGRFVDSRSDNILNSKFFTFFVLKNAPDSHHTGKDAIVSQCKVVADKIISKMLYDRRNYLNMMERLDVNTITFEQVGPIGSAWHGINISFFLMDNPGDIVFHAIDWN